MSSTILATIRHPTIVRESVLPAIPGSGKEMEFKTDRQTAKIMTAITKSRARAAHTNDHRRSTDSALQQISKITNGAGPNV